MRSEYKIKYSDEGSGSAVSGKLALLDLAEDVEVPSVSPLGIF